MQLLAFYCWRVECRKYAEVRDMRFDNSSAGYLHHNKLEQDEKWKWAGMTLAHVEVGKNIKNVVMSVFILPENHMATFGVIPAISNLSKSFNKLIP